MRIALWIAVVEGIIVALAHDFRKWTVIVDRDPGLVHLPASGAATLARDTVRQVSWIVAASQALAVVVAILAFSSTGSRCSACIVAAIAAARSRRR